MGNGNGKIECVLSTFCTAGGDIEKLRNELLSLCDKLKEGDLDENVCHLRYKIENFSKLAIEQMKENAESKEAVVDIKGRLPSPAPPQPERVENADRAKKEPGSPSGTTPAKESDLSKLP